MPQIADEIDTSFVDLAVERAGATLESAIPVLQAIQEHYGYLPEAALRRVCEVSDITPARLTGVASFYSEFRHKPVGRHLVRVCHGTACHVKGAGGVSEAFARRLGIPEGDDTDPDRAFTIQKVACLGCCSLAVAVQVDDVIYGHVTPERVPKVLRDVLELERRSGESRRSAAPPPPAGAGEVRICVDSCCAARGSRKVYEAVERAIEETGARASLKRVSCVVVCNETPLVEVADAGGTVARYAGVEPQDARAIVLRHFRPAGAVARVRSAVSVLVEKVLTDAAWEPVTRYSVNMREPRITSFLGPQKHIAMEHYGLADPGDIDEYIALGGFGALERAVTNSSSEGGEELIGIIDRSGLRGRGGAGFPTAMKWRAVRDAAGDEKYIVANGDEGDPGAFMDRMLLESFPYRVIEGMAIASYAVGAREGRLYIRSEYPFAVKRMTDAIARAKERGYLGASVLGTDHALELMIMRGAGAFVCGEETALLESLEGRRGSPRIRPPYPAEKGFRGKPTLVNNVETYSVIPWIVREGASGFAELGTERSKGTKVFALAGKTVRGGLIEVPMGITIREIVEGVGGGIAEGRELKAVLVGGPSGGCIPERLADTRVDYEALTELGAMMGSGGFVVLDDSDCVVDIARYFLEFTQNQSCGKCTFCRVGTRRMLEVLERIAGGEGKPKDLDELERLASFIREGSLCGLGKTAPNPVLTTLKYFRGEYEAHISGRCPAGRCVKLVRYVVTDKCIGCTKCAQNCPADAIAMRPYEQHEVDDEKCTRCGICRQICPSDAIVVE
ncbi:MAG: NAD(P)H-dependent oxidoreductase subunit E [Planctomycetota bacterium]|jgi:NADH:ubiquinone oxidoreductase subunit F (NADH-binding)/NADH:ubiquinone oxidoreductase subunit E